MKTYTISEVAKMVGVSTSTIRYYDGLGLLLKIHRKNGQRFFTQDDVGLLSILICLKNTGMSIKGLQIRPPDSARG